MGSSVSYQEHGKHHADTQSYKDEDQLASIGAHPKKINAIRVWADTFIVGMEVFYDGVSAGARYGTHGTAGMVQQDFLLGETEYLSSVSGRSGDIIDQITFTTTAGRTQSFGGTGGSAFTLKEDGKIIKGFTLGFGGHLHFVGVHFEALVAAPVKVMQLG